MTKSSRTGRFVLTVLSLAAYCHGGPILFVSDNTTDSVNIPAVLTGDGHTVTVVTNDYGTGNATLSGPLVSYDAVFWSATGTGLGSTHTSAALFTNLSNYVSAGGFVFVTGYDSTASPDDPNLRTFLGAGNGQDFGGSGTGPVIAAPNALSTGVIDIQGVVPTGGYSDYDSLSALSASTVGVVSNNSSGYRWTLRSLGFGEIAYVSNGGPINAPEHASWLDTSAGGPGAYNAALRNFAANASSDVIPEPATLSLLALGGLGILRRRRRR